MREMFKIAKFLLPPIRKNYEYHVSAWDARNNPSKEGEIWKAIKYSLPSCIQKEFREKYHDYSTPPDEYWIGILVTLETRDDSRSAACDEQKPLFSKKKKHYFESAGTDSNREAISEVPHQKKNPNPVKGRQKTAIHNRGQCSFVLCNKSVYPERRYKSCISE